MTSTQDKELSSSVYAEVTNSTKGKLKINIDGFYTSRTKTVTICIIGFVNVNDKRKCDVLQESQQFVLEIRIKFANSGDI